MDNISNNNIGNQAVNIDTELTSFCNNLINSGLTDGQKELLLLKVQRILNTELKTADNVITKTQNLGKKVDVSVKDYRNKIKKSQPYGLTTGSAGGLAKPLRGIFWYRL